MPRKETVSNTTSEVGLSSQPIDLFREFFKMQSESFAELINVVKNSNEVKNVLLPKFNSDLPDSDAKQWCHTVDLILAEKPISGSELILALSGALEGEAAQWLSQVCYTGMSWNEFKELFMQRFKSDETAAATVISLLCNRPKNEECISAYGNRMVTSLMTTWKTSTVEEIAVSVVLAHMTQVDNRLQRLAFTKNIKTRSELQVELKAFSFGKRKNNNDYLQQNEKKMKLMSNIKCHFCGKLGHKQADCRSKKDDYKGTKKSGEMRQDNKSTIVCYKCGKTGHISTVCGNRNLDNKKFEKQVNLCSIVKPKGTLLERGESFSFYFDSGAECSLIKETVANKFSGKRFNNVVTLRGLGNAAVFSTIQIESSVVINNYMIDILFHVVLDKELNYDIVIGSEILCDGFCVTTTDREFIFEKKK